MDMFEKVGETLRRVRKDSGKTLEQLGEDAGLGRGQLSRIENGRQEATFKTLSKILQTHGMSRREFFRRLDLVEAEALAVENPSGAGGQELYDLSGNQWPAEVRDMLSRAVSTDPRALQTRTIAQGAVEMGDVVVLFRVVPRGLPPAAPASPPPAGPSSPHPGGGNDVDDDQASPSEAPSQSSRSEAPHRFSRGEALRRFSRGEASDPSSSRQGEGPSPDASAGTEPPGPPATPPPGPRPFRRGRRQRG